MRNVAQMVDDWFRNSPESQEFLENPHHIDEGAEVEDILSEQIANPQCQTFHRDEISRAIRLWVSDAVLACRSKRDQVTNA